MSDSVPSGWAMVEFDSFTTLQRGKDLTKAEFRDGTVPVAGSNGVIGYHDTAIAKAPGVTVGRSGSAGKVTVYEEDFWPHNTSLYVRDFHGNDPYFAGFLLGSLNLSRFKTGASVPTLDRNSFKTLPILVPPLPEQKKIAHILSTVQRAVEAQERIIQTTTELKKALMHKLFTEGLRNEPQKQTEIGPVPESWALLPIGDLFETQLGKMLSQKAKVGDSPKAYLRNKNVQWGRIDTHDLLRMDFNDREAEKFQLRKGDLLVCEGGEVGRAALWDGGIAECYYQKALHRLRPKTNQITNEFMVHWMMFAFLLTNTYGVTGTRTTIAHLPEIKLKPLLVSVPSPDEQAEIVKELVTVDQKLAVHQGKLGVLQNLFRTLLHELMNAKIRVYKVAIK
jgi:type I restriction enzyme S subunit